MNIEDIKRHGAVIGLESELKVKIRNITDSAEKKNWAACHSHAVYISELAEELRKLNDNKTT